MGLSDCNAQAGYERRGIRSDGQVRPTGDWTLNQTLVTRSADKAVQQDASHDSLQATGRLVVTLSHTITDQCVVVPFHLYRTSCSGDSNKALLLDIYPQRREELRDGRREPQHDRALMLFATFPEP